MINVIKEQIDRTKKLSERQKKYLKYQNERVINKDFHDVTIKIKNLSSKIQDTYQITSFAISEEEKEKIRSLITEMLNYTDKNPVTENKIKSYNKQIDTIEKNISLEWSKYYTDISSPAMAILNLLTKLDDKRIDNCIRKITSGEEWTSSRNNKIALMNGIKLADDIIKNLNLENEIIIFLQKINNNQASLLDVTDDVLSWLRTNNLDKKLKLGFF